MSNILLFILYSILILTLIHLFAIGYIKYRSSKKPPITLISNNDKMESIEYSEKLIKFAKDLIIEISTFRFSEFIDARNPEKVSRIHYEKLAGEVAKEVYEKINIKNILFEYTIFTKKYFEELIILYSINVNKSLLEKYYNEINGGK